MAKKSRSQFRNLPEPLEKVELTALVQRLRTGDLSVSHPIILSHMRLAMAMVRRYVAKGYHAKADDLEGEAMLALVHAVHLAPTMLDNDEITPYIIVWINRRIGKFIREDSMVRIPAGTRKAAGTKPPKVSATCEKVVCKVREVAFSWAVARETLAKICLTQLETDTVKLKALGHTDAEVGDILGLPPLRVSRIRYKLQERWNALDGD
jgi:hypothetical protein